MMASYQGECVASVVGITRCDQRNDRRPHRAPGTRRSSQSRLVPFSRLLPDTTAKETETASITPPAIAIHAQNLAK